jgi:hypothetical protein
MSAPSLATTPTAAHDLGLDCLFSSGLWEMTQFDMSSVNRYCVVAEVTAAHAQDSRLKYLLRSVGVKRC